MLELNEDGYIEVKLGESVVTLDLYEAYNTAVQIHREDDADGRIVRWVEWLSGRGLAGISQRAAWRVYEALSARVDELKKADSGARTPS